ncbi:nucleoside triphosphate pyrophosphohydrolase [Sporanaerobium hydrogeniformans]|uniref:Nucleoside triphosphate pyrophosphohydrolase n=1 Tax=Sporanaerobium hydrogeniformans TaxID=3072179 RepID=A0AC61DAR9_9FIRM|nr:nucleoside triphosphate pyrophosphohydrolase [Sporanaerobium hydrogeniformans]PHV70369.1 nucleoside triphosphate pyrophosphohydrolase [Sporanaerobium hydrogeniformans]
MEDKYTYKQLVDIVERLRGENGCPWDRAQTHISLLPHLMEESYELMEAIKKQDIPNMKEELGDVFLQVLLHSQIAKEEGSFTMEEVIHELASKLVYRHPHVFQDVPGADTPDKVLVTWEALKKIEKNEKSVTESMERVAKALPALIKAQKVQKKAAKVGFFWEDAEGVIDKIMEELEEVREAMRLGNNTKVEEELGDLLFSVVNLSTFFDLNPEFALTKSLEKFINRFRYIENTAFSQGKELKDISFEEMDRLWDDCKKLE